MITRRQLLASVALATTPGFAAAQNPPAGEGAKLAAMLDAFFQEDLQRYPEKATNLGLDKGALAALKTRLDDRSEAGYARDRDEIAGQLRRLRQLDRQALSAAERVNHDAVEQWRVMLGDVQAMGFGTQRGVSPSPYVVTQMSGSAYYAIPEFLDTRHVVETKEDAEDYLLRLAGFATALDQDTARMAHDAGAGVIPPDFTLDLAIGQLTALRTAPTPGLVASIDRRAKAKGLGDSYGPAAAQIFAGQVAPALERQIAQATKLRAKATHAAGVGRLKDGEAHYAAFLRYATTTALSAAEVHQLGLDQAAEISGRLDGLLKQNGLTQGSVGARLAALAADPAYLFPNTDAGKVEIIAFVNSQLDLIRPRLSRAFSRQSPYSFEVRRVPTTQEAGAAGAYSQNASLDGKRPGYVYFNLKDSADWPRWALPTTAFHEGLPGHQLEGGLALTNPGIPVLLKTGPFGAYAEGWGLYAEQLADELGVYEDFPLGRLGYLQWQLFRAGRCVVDTGIHQLGWSREKAIGYLAGLTGQTQGGVAREIERYAAMPGQACSYKIGHTMFARLRGEAQAALGARYDIRAYHDQVLAHGRLPLNVLESEVRRWLQAARA